jgi:hypothetical protein
MTTKPNADCKSKGLCHYDGGTRTKFFNGMLLTDEHLRVEQTYHREALGRLHRYLWGPGIVCGLEVEWVSALCIKVHPGLAIDCHGNAIELCQCLTIDLGEECKKQYPGGCTPSEAKPFTKHLVVRYAVSEEDPQPVLTTGDECGGSSRCEKSRVREGFCLELVDKCPPPCDEDEKTDSTGVDPRQQTTQQAAAPSDARNASYPGGQPQRPKPGMPECMKPLRPCPPCKCGCDTCDIGLATLQIDCTEAYIVVTCDCRTYAHERRKHNALYDRLGDQDRKAAALEKRSLDIDRRVAELEKLKRDVDQGLQQVKAAGGRVEQFEDRIRALAPANRVEALESGRTSDATKIAALEAQIQLLNSQVVALLQRGQRQPRGGSSRGGSPPAPTS